MKPVDDPNEGGVTSSVPVGAPPTAKSESKTGLYIAIAVVVGIVIYFLAK